MSVTSTPALEKKEEEKPVKKNEEIKSKHMKSLLFIIPIFCFFSYSSESKKIEKCYYFGLSRPIKSDSTFNTVFYFDIKDTTGAAIRSNKLAVKWSEIVDKRCATSSGCTSDLNVYFTWEEAKKNLDNAIKIYGVNYKLEKVPF